eukprot:m.130369 g.130369  ORF g.130369 m.130369 type:complete len:70 (-) comp15872_c0_seq2:282-491(-)
MLLLVFVAVFVTTDCLLQCACRASSSIRYSIKGLLGESIETKWHGGRERKHESILQATIAENDNFDKYV